MDPNANLKELRELAAELIRLLDAEDHIDENDVNRLCELVEALDQWISRGGFLPAAWSDTPLEDPDRGSFTMSRRALGKLLGDYDQLFTQVTDTQRSNTKLLEENRAMKRAMRDLLEKRDAAPAGATEPIQSYDGVLAGLRRFLS